MKILVLSFALLFLIAPLTTNAAPPFNEQNIFSMPESWGETDVFLSIGGQLVCPQIVLYQSDYEFDEIEETDFMQNQNQLRTPLDDLIMNVVNRVDQVQAEAFINKKPLTCLRSNQKQPLAIPLAANQIAIIFFRGLQQDTQGESFIAIVFLKEPGRFFYTTSTLHGNHQQIWNPGLKESDMEWFHYRYGNPPDKVTFRILNPLDTKTVPKNLFLLQFLYENYKDLSKETIDLKEAVYERCLREEEKKHRDSLAQQTDFEAYQKTLKALENTPSECMIYKPEKAR